MSRLALAAMRADEFKRQWAGEGPIRDTEHAKAMGERWVAAMFERYGLTEQDMDDASVVIERIGADTMTNLGRMLQSGDIGTRMMLACVFAAGWTNGLAVGLELTRE